MRYTGRSLECDQSINFDNLLLSILYAEMFVYMEYTTTYAHNN